MLPWQLRPKSIWKAIGRVLGYLKRTINIGLFYGDLSTILEGFIDASWVTSVSDNKYMSGWVFNLRGDAILWAFKK